MRLFARVRPLKRTAVQSRITPVVKHTVFGACALVRVLRARGGAAPVGCGSPRGVPGTPPFFTSQFRCFDDAEEPAGAWTKRMKVGVCWRFGCGGPCGTVRKGKAEDCTENDMGAVVSVHNSMNEDTWRRVMTWERLHSDECRNPMLLRFLGRPDDLSPLAWARYFTGGGKPFDR